MVLSDELRPKIKAGTAPLPRTKRPLRFHRRLITGIAACLVLVFGVAAAAGVFTNYENLIAWLGEDKRDLMPPVMMESQGVGAAADTDMQVLAAINDSESAVVFFALSDPAGRIDERTELYDVEITGTMMSHGEIAYYDEETESAVFRLAGNGQQAESGETVTVTVNSVLLGVERFDKIDTGITLAQMTTETQPAFEEAAGLDEYGFPANAYSVMYGEDEAAAEDMMAQLDDDSMPLLAKAESAIVPDGASWLSIDAAAVVGGYLHVRYSAATEAGRYAMTDLFLTWPGGQQTAWDRNLTTATRHLGDATEIGYYRLYDAYEAIIELPEGVPYDQITLAIGGSSCEGLLEGNWSVSFVLDDSPSQLTADVDIDLGGWSINRVTVSPIGITAYGVGEPNENSETLFLEAFDENGESIEIVSVFSSHSYEPSLNVSRSEFARPVNIEDISRLEVNGQVIELQPDTRPNTQPGAA